MNTRAFFVVSAALFFFIAGAEVRAQSKVINVSAADVLTSGATVVFVPDGGCLLIPTCSTALPEVSCNATARPMNRGSACGNFRTAVARAAALDVGVSDGGQP